MRVAIKTFGCRVNQLAAERAGAVLETHGHPLTSPADCTLLIVNTCTVTAHTDHKIRSFINNFHTKHPTCPLYVTGCGAVTSADFYRALPAVTALYPDFTTLLAALQLPAPGALPPAPRRTRAYVQIQTGCENFCSYCIVPYARGRGSSRPAAAIVAEIQQLVNAGYQEVVLTGINIGAYGAPRTTAPKESQLAALITQILQTTALPRLHLSSLGPQYLSPALQALFSDPRLCAHWHISLQSGSDEILRRMHRPYDTALVAEQVAALRRATPHLAISADVITGFPGETEYRWHETVDFLTALRPARLHVFPYSVRPGTAAAALPQLPEAVRRTRAATLRGLAADWQQAYWHSLIGQDLSVLFETQTATQAVGLSAEYVPVRVPTDQPLRQTIHPVHITAADQHGLTGQRLG